MSAGDLLATTIGRYRGEGVRGGRTHGVCRVCGRPTERVRNGQDWRRTCSPECRTASGRPWMRAQVLEQRRLEDAGLLPRKVPQHLPEATSGPRMAPRTCVFCNKVAPAGLVGNRWREGDVVHFLDD